MFSAYIIIGKVKFEVEFVCQSLKDLDAFCDNFGSGTITWNYRNMTWRWKTLMRPCAAIPNCRMLFIIVVAFIWIKMIRLRPSAILTRLFVYGLSMRKHFLVAAKH